MHEPMAGDWIGRTARLPPPARLRNRLSGRLAAGLGQTRESGGAEVRPPPGAGAARHRDVAHRGRRSDSGVRLPARITREVVFHDAPLWAFEPRVRTRGRNYRP